MELDMDFITVLVIAFVAMWVGWVARGIIMLARFGTDPEHFIEILQKIKEINDKEQIEGKEQAIGTELAIERVGNELYAYAKDTNQFIAQGSNLDKLMEEAKKRFPDRRFFGVISKDNSAKELAQ